MNAGPLSGAALAPADPLGGEMGARIEAFDWSKTALGAQKTWSVALRTTVRILLANRFPMLLWWGPEYVCLYNDASRSILGRKHPRALGKPVREVWSEIWDLLQPLIDTPFQGGPSTWSDDIDLYLNRSGFTEETHFAIAYSPVPDDAVETGIGGVLATVTEVTEKVLGRRRMTILRDLSARAMEARAPEEACAASAAILGSNPKDVSFALFYLADEDGTEAHLTASCGLSDSADMAPAEIPLDHAGSSGWPLGEIDPSGVRTVTDLGSRFKDVPAGPWPDAPHTAMILAMRSHGGRASGFLIVGLSSHLTLDDGYKDFLELATSQISTAVAHAHAYVQERRRTEALSELDQAEAQFLSNVSHEFGTPLTLTRGSREEFPKQVDPLAPGQLKRRKAAHANSAEPERSYRAAQFETLLNQAPMGVFLVNSDFRFQHLNPTARATFEGVADPLGRPFEEVIREVALPEYADEVLRIFRHTLETGEPYVTAERESRRIENGRKLFFEWRVDRIPLADGRHGVVCYFHDITALVRARQAFAESEQRLSLAVEGAGMGTWDVDLTTGESIWSGQHFAMLGYEPTKDRKASLEMWRSRVHPEDLQRVDHKIQGALATGMRYISEHRILRADTDEIRWLSEFGNVVRDDDGKAVRFVGISFDNTARNRAEQEQARTAEHLRRVNEDLEQFAYSASHDLQEPLRGVRIYSELLAMELAGKLTDKGRDCLAQVREGSERMETLLADLTAYIEACGIEHDVRETADAEESLQDALANLAATIKEADACIEHGPLPSLHVDATRLQQIFQNLVANAIKYRNPDMRPEIHISAEPDDRMWRFAVRDNGIGIAPEFHAQIFGLFKRLHTRHKYAGTGIGLALCARIVGQYHGRIWVESALGEGATFYFTLPA